MKKQGMILKGKVNAINRFNKDPHKLKFFENFQEIIIQRLNLNYINKYNKKNVNRIIRSITGKPKGYINTDIKKGFLLTCNVEPEIYIQIQETAKKVTGDFLPMDELIYHLLTYFCYIYKDKNPKNILPYKHRYKGKSLSKLIKFQNRFTNYYKNSVSNFME